MQVVAIPKQDIPAKHKYSNMGVSEGELTRMMYQVVDNTLGGKKAVKDPSGYLAQWLRDVSQQCGLSQ
jgi:hypothetical protein